MNPIVSALPPTVVAAAPTASPRGGSAFAAVLESVATPPTAPASTTNAAIPCEPDTTATPAPTTTAQPAATPWTFTSSPFEAPPPPPSPPPPDAEPTLAQPAAKEPAPQPLIAHTDAHAAYFQAISASVARTAAPVVTAPETLAKTPKLPFTKADAKLAPALTPRLAMPTPTAPSAARAPVIARTTKQDTQDDTADPAAPADTNANADANAPAPAVAAAVDVAPNAAMASMVQAAVSVVAPVANAASSGTQDGAMPAMSAPAISPSKATGPRAKPATRDASPAPSPAPADAHTKSNATTGEDDRDAPDARAHRRVQPAAARAPAIDSSPNDASNTAKTPDAPTRTPDPIADTTLAMPRMAPVVEAAARSGDSRLALEGTDDRQRAVTSALNQMTVRHGAQGRIEVPELGTVHVEARQVAGAIAIDVRTERADAAQTLQHAHGSLISSVREGDMPVWKVDIAHDASHFESRAESGERHTRDEARDERAKSDDDALTPGPRKTRARFVL